MGDDDAGAAAPTQRTASGGARFGGSERSVRGGVALDPSVRGGVGLATTLELLGDADTATWPPAWLEPHAVSSPSAAAAGAFASPSPEVVASHHLQPMPIPAARISVAGGCVFDSADVGLCPPPSSLDRVSPSGVLSSLPGSGISIGSLSSAGAAESGSELVGDSGLYLRRSMLRCLPLLPT